MSFQGLPNGNYRQANPHDPLYVGEGIYHGLGKLPLLSTEECPIGFRAYVFAPNSSNVYTFLDALALDSGTAGIIQGSSVMGMAWVYNRVRTRAMCLLVLR